MACVYILFLSDDPEKIRYVGRSKHNSHEARLKTHISNARNGDKSHVCNWIRKSIKNNSMVVGMTLETNLSWDKSAIREVYYIKKYKKEGNSLTNMSRGGEGRGIGYKLSNEARKRIGVHTKSSMKSQHENYRNNGLVWGKDLGPKQRISDEVRKRIKDDRAGGLSLRAIAQGLDAEDIKTAYGGKWTASTINYVLNENTEEQK